MNERYNSSDLIAFASTLLTKVGMEGEKASAIADILVEADLLGHTTHGLNLLGLYLTEIEAGKMTRSGDKQVIADFPAALTWDGMRLPGQWLTLQAIEVASQRAKALGTCTVVIKRSHHIGALAAYLKRVTDQGLMMILTCSDPYSAGVAPHGGRTGVFTPNPLGAGWPTKKDPVMFDVCQSITTNIMTRRLHAEGKKFPGKWVIDSDGSASDDPSVMFKEPPGAFLPTGGEDHGHKGYAFGLLVEALTGGLAGHGRADPREGWSSTTYLQVIDPALFGGSDAFSRQMSNLSDTCHKTQPRAGFERVRLPGESGLRKRESQLKDGVDLYPNIVPALKIWSEKLGVPLPSPRN
jgi:LDH2 family malate/lactate/ureidoglycolate dehydrogenase